MSPIPTSALETRFLVLDTTTTLTASIEAVQFEFGEDPEAWVMIEIEPGTFRATQVGRLAHLIDAEGDLGTAHLLDDRVDMVHLDVVDNTIGVGEANRVVARSPDNAVVVLSNEGPDGIYLGPTLGATQPPRRPPTVGARPPEAAPPDDGAPGRGTEGDGATADARRLGADTIVDGDKLENAFVSNAEHTIRISIGRSSTHQADMAEPDFEGAAELDLPVWAYDGTRMHSGTITLPADTSLDATDPFEFPFTPTGDDVAIEVVVYEADGNSVLQAALLSGRVVASLADEAEAEPSIAFKVVDVGTFTRAPDSLPKGSVVHTESGLVTKAGTTPIGIDGPSASAWVAQAVTLIQRAASAHAQFDTPIEQALVQLAFFGSVKLATHPRLRNLEPFDRIQVVSLTERNVLPLELLYSGDVDRDGATLCDNWESALETGTCAGCNDNPADGSVVCPLRFWSMSKIIEHHGSTGEVPNHFQAAGIRTVASTGLGSLSPALVGVSERVSAADADALESVRESTEQAIGTAASAADWNEWITEIEGASPGLLVAMPHQGIEQIMGTSTAILELGGSEEIVAAPKYVTARTSAPGPVVVLLGCDTAAGIGPMDYSSAALFRAYGAAIVVSSLGKVLAATAPDAAVALVEAISEGTGTRTFGEAFLATRRALLAKSNLLALMLVSHGDNEWRLS